jgi:hypothetical protein
VAVARRASLVRHGGHPGVSLVNLVHEIQQACISAGHIGVGVVRTQVRSPAATAALPVRVGVDIKMLQTCWQPAGAVRQQPALGAWAASAAAAEAAEPSSTGRAGHIGMRKVRAKVGPPATMASRPAVAGTYPETHQPVFNILITAPVTISWDGWRHRCGRGVCWALSFSNGRDTYPSLPTPWTMASDRGQSRPRSQVVCLFEVYR